MAAEQPAADVRILAVAFRSPVPAGKVIALCPDSRNPVDFRETQVTDRSETGVQGDH